jgi:hypothetical protein
MKLGYVRWTLGVLLGVGAMTSYEAASQGWRGRDQVCVYEHADFGGWEQCYGPGESIRDLGSRRNRISSVRIMGRAQVTLFEHPDFRGNDVEVRDDVSDLSRWPRWNDQTDSLRVHGGGYDDRSRSGRRDDDRVCVYEHVEYRGRYQCFEGDDLRDLRRGDWNDRISSIRTFGRTRVVFHEHVNFEGERLVVHRDIPDLTRVHAQDGSTWNDRISSVRMRDSGWDRRPVGR